MNKSLRRHLQSFMCKEQHGLMPKRSTFTNLCVYDALIMLYPRDTKKMNALSEGYQENTISI